MMYKMGAGVAQDYSKALEWFHKAADQGRATALYNIGAMYFIGQGVPKDYVQAYFWFELAASHATDQATRSQAVRNRGLVAANMTPAQIAEARRMASRWTPK
jgi:hypothetical protein